MRELELLTWSDHKLKCTSNSATLAETCVIVRRTKLNEVLNHKNGCECILIYMRIIHMYGCVVDDKLKRAIERTIILSQ